MEDSMNKGRAEMLIAQMRTNLEGAREVPLTPGKVIVDKEELMFLLHNLSEAVKTEMKTYREVTDKKAKIINDAKAEAESIILEAETNASRIRVTKRREDDTSTEPVIADLGKSEKLALRTANDIYAASLIYTDEMLSEVDHLMSDAYEMIEQELKKVQTTLKKKMDGVADNKAELVKNLTELSKNDRYAQILEISQLLANELYYERERARALQLEQKYQLAFDFSENEGETDGITVNPDRTAVKIDVKRVPDINIKTRPRNPEMPDRKKIIVDQAVLDEEKISDVTEVKKTKKKKKKSDTSEV